MNKCLIVTAWGLGDWILINPIVRNLSKKYDFVGLTYNDYCKKFLKHMFYDLSNIYFEYDCGNKLPDVNIAKKYCIKNNFVFIDLMLPGHFNESKNYIVDTTILNKPYNHFLYEKLWLNWEDDCKSYYVPIDNAESYNFFKSLNLPKEYIFIHEGPYPKINKDYIHNKNAYIFYPHEIENVFLYKNVIENASEIHVVDSGFYNLSDKFDVKTDKLYLHRTKILQSPFLEPKLNKEWIKIDY